MSQYIFLDESGDLGFSANKSVSKYFVVTILFTREKKQIENIVKKIHSRLRKKVKAISGGILHCYKEKPITRKRLLSKLAKKQCSIVAIYLNKSKVYTKLRDEKHVLYNYVVNILLDRIMTRKFLDITSEITLIAAKRETNRFLNENFKNYLKSQLKSNHKLDLKIDIKTSGEEKAL